MLFAINNCGIKNLCRYSYSKLCFAVASVAALIINFVLFTVSTFNSVFRKMDLSQLKKLYEVEAIVNKKVTANGKVLFYLKWKNYPNSQNTWEPAEHLDLASCAELISDYENRARKKNIKGRPITKNIKRRYASTKAKRWSSRCDAAATRVDLLSTGERKRTHTSSRRNINSNPEHPSARRKHWVAKLIPEEIRGANFEEKTGEIQLLVKWRGIREPSPVYSRELRILHPQLLIDFYENLPMDWDDSCVDSL